MCSLRINVRACVLFDFLCTLSVRACIFIFACACVWAGGCTLCVCLVCVCLYIYIYVSVCVRLIFVCTVL